LLFYQLLVLFSVTVQGVMKESGFQLQLFR
jgi:hypothetical protein